MMTETTSQAFDITEIRASFPALQQDHQVYFDNAGGSQVLGDVATWYAYLMMLHDAPSRGILHDIY